MAAGKDVPPAEAEDSDSSEEEEEEEEDDSDKEGKKEKEKMRSDSSEKGEDEKEDDKEDDEDAVFWPAEQFFFWAWRSPAEDNALKRPDHGHTKRSWRAEVHRRTAAGIYRLT